MPTADRTAFRFRVRMRSTVAQQVAPLRATPSAAISSPRLATGWRVAMGCTGLGRCESVRLNFLPTCRLALATSWRFPVASQLAICSESPCRNTCAVFTAHRRTVSCCGSCHNATILIHAGVAHGVTKGGHRDGTCRVCGNARCLALDAAWCLPSADARAAAKRRRHCHSSQRQPDQASARATRPALRQYEAAPPDY